jgi:hypothetical protein
MLSQTRTADPGTTTTQATTLLTRLAESVNTLWQQIEHWPVNTVCAQIDGDRLVFTASVALNEARRELIATDVGYRSALRDLTRALDKIYSPLADAIERSLHCYVGAMQVDLEPEQSLVVVQFHLREAPGLWRITQPESTCP